MIRFRPSALSFRFGFLASGLAAFAGEPDSFLAAAHLFRCASAIRFLPAALTFRRLPSGAPDWRDETGRNQLYDIEARAPGDGVPTMDEVRQMLQTLLAERFQLKFHRDPARPARAGARRCCLPP
jgi:hypothetical protein